MKFLLLTLVFLILAGNVIAQETIRSNEVTTRVGTPTTTTPTTGGSSGPVGITVSCPFFQNGGFTPVNVTCGTAKNPINGCGHGVPPAYPPCKAPPYATCPFSNQLKAAVDVRMPGTNGGGLPVYLPFINGNQRTNWVKVSGPISINGGAWGQKVEYVTVFNNKTIRLDMTHLSAGVFLSTGESGNRIGTTMPGVDGGTAGHLHTAASIDGVWLDSIDQSFICSNRTP